MNGVSCRRLLDHVDEIFASIRILVHDRILINTMRTRPIDQNELDRVLDKFCGIFKTLDLVFSLLRQFDPTEDEMIQIEKGIEVLEKE